MLTNKEIENYKSNGAVFLKRKFDVSWIEKLKEGIKKDIKNPSPRFKSHTIEKNIPAYLEDYWTWDLVPEFKEFVYKSPYAKIASELATREATTVNTPFALPFGNKSVITPGVIFSIALANQPEFETATVPIGKKTNTFIIVALLA